MKKISKAIFIYIKTPKKLNKESGTPTIEKKQAQKGFRPISVSQNFWGILWEFFGNALGVL